MSDERSPGRGDIWLARLDPNEGFEQAGTRPVLVISGNRYNRLQPGLRVIVPLTTRDRELPFHIRIDPPAGGLRAPSFVISEQPRTISTQRLVAYRGEAPGVAVASVMEWVNDFLND